MKSKVYFTKEITPASIVKICESLMNCFKAH